jgi:hypothetical protein
MRLLKARYGGNSTVMTRISRTVAVLAAALIGLLAFASPIAAQDSTPAGGPTSVTVGQTEVAWSGAWQYDSGSSMDQQATLTQVDAGSGSLKLATYGEFQDDTVDTPADALEAFSGAFFDGAGAESVVEAGSGELDNGATWKIYTFDLQGLQLTFLATVSQADDGSFIVSTLTGNTDQFSATIDSAQQEITLNGEPTFLDGVDAAEVTSGLNATPVGSPVASPAA